MTEQEFREKIINTIKENGVYNGKSMHRDYYVVNDEELADALIAAGIGDVKKLQFDNEVLKMKNFFLEGAERSTEEDRQVWISKWEEAEHRALVAELVVKNLNDIFTFDYQTVFEQAEKELEEERKDD